MSEYKPVLIEHEIICQICEDEGWVCEDHPKKNGIMEMVVVEEPACHANAIKHNRPGILFL